VRSCDGSDPTKVLFESADNCWAPQGPFSVFCEKRRELQEPNILGPVFGLEVDFWSVFGHFWWFLEVAWLPFYGFI
jgi:hypothetical protein